MTDQSPNDLFHASSFMQGHNAEYLEQMYARYAADPNAVDDAWAEFFRALGDAESDVRKEASGPSWARTDWPLSGQSRAPTTILIAVAPLAERMTIRFGTGLRHS